MISKLDELRELREKLNISVNGLENIKENKNELLELYYELGKIEAFISIGIYKEIVIAMELVC